MYLYITYVKIKVEEISPNVKLNVTPEPIVSAIECAM